MMNLLKNTAILELITEVTVVEVVPFGGGFGSGSSGGGGAGGDF